MLNRLGFIITIFVSLAVVACQSSKETPSSQQDVKNMSLHERFDALTSSYTEWTDLNIPVKLELTSPKRFSISGRAIMERGKSILISLRFLGMEVGNLYIAGDSVYAVEKINKYYVAESLERALGGFPVTINDIQDMLLGRAFLLEGGTLSADDYKKTELATSSGLWTITPKKSLSGINYVFDVSDENNAVTSLTASKNGKILPVKCRYSSHLSNTGAGTIAQVTSVTGTLGKHDIAASLRWSVGDARWNTGNVRQWRMPENYSRIPASNVLKILESF